MATDTTPTYTMTTFSEIKKGDHVVMFGRNGPKVYEIAEVDQSGQTTTRYRYGDVYEIADAAQDGQTTQYRYAGDQAVWEAPADWPVKVVD